MAENGLYTSWKLEHGNNDVERQGRKDQRGGALPVSDQGPFYDAGLFGEPLAQREENTMKKDGKQDCSEANPGDKDPGIQIRSDVFHRRVVNSLSNRGRMTSNGWFPQRDCSRGCSLASISYDVKGPGSLLQERVMVKIG